MKINIKIKNRTNLFELNVDTDKKICEINKENYEADTELIALKVYAMVHKWPENISTPSALDGEKYRITIVSDENRKVFTGENSFPVNYNEFKEYVYSLKNLKIAKRELE